MSLLLVTKVLIRWLAADARLPSTLAEEMENPGNRVVVGAATV